MYASMYIGAVKLKAGPRFGGFKVKTGPSLKLKTGPSFFIVFRIFCFCLFYVGEIETEKRKTNKMERPKKTIKIGFF